MNAIPAADSKFWDRTARRYANKPVDDEEAYRLTLERVRHYLTPQHRVLELGCGTGTTALLLAPVAGPIVATDLSGEMISIAEEKGRAQGASTVQFARTTADDSSFEAESFDVVMAFNLLHLLPDIPGTLRRVHALLKPGGLFISKTPCMKNNSFIIRAIIPLMQAFGRAPFVNFFAKDSLHSAIIEAGFEVVETGLYPVKSCSYFVVGRKAQG